MAGLLLAAYGYWEATRTPRVVEYAVTTPRWTAPPVRIALLSDVHVAGPDMPPERLAGIVRIVNGLAPDIIVLAGDFLGGRIVQSRSYPPEQALAPLGGLRARLGVYAVLGNHDMIDPGPPSMITAALRRGGITVLRNAVVAAPGGRFLIAGMDDPAAGVGWPGVPAVLARARAGPPVLLIVHNPDLFASTPQRAAVTLAGHTHGGQIAPPGIGPIVLPVTHREWVRGVHSRGAQRLIVTSGAGASGVPLRIGVPPEVVIVRLSGSA